MVAAWRRGASGEGETRAVFGKVMSAPSSQSSSTVLGQHFLLYVVI